MIQCVFIFNIQMCIFNVERGTRGLNYGDREMGVSNIHIYHHRNLNQIRSAEKKHLERNMGHGHGTKVFR